MGDEVGLCKRKYKRLRAALILKALEIELNDANRGRSQFECAVKMLRRRKELEGDDLSAQRPAVRSRCASGLPDHQFSSDPPPKSRVAPRPTPRSTETAARPPRDRPSDPSSSASDPAFSPASDSAFSPASGPASGVAPSPRRESIAKRFYNYGKRLRSSFVARRKRTWISDDVQDLNTGMRFSCCLESDFIYLIGVDGEVR